MQELTHSPYQYPTSPRFHIMGFVDDSNAVREVESILRDREIDDSRLAVYSPIDDRDTFTELMYNSLWGEAAERFLHDGLREFDHGHFVISVSTHREHEAREILEALEPAGIHGVVYFGAFVDTQFTA